jgi:hypothetical protein
VNAFPFATGDHTEQITSAMFTPIFGVMQHLDLSDAVLTKELADITGNDRYPFSSRIQTLRAILGKLRPEPVREPLFNLADGGIVG